MRVIGKSNPILSKKKQIADEMALRDGKTYVVVNMGNGAYEIYPKSVAVKWIENMYMRLRAGHAIDHPR